jgi:undecaprenyl-diphosphatase
VTVLQAIILGVIQGLTEFLPVSSSGHLVIFQHLMGLREGTLAFDVLLHMGTLVAVSVAFWDDILAILRKPLSKLTYLVVVGCIPAGLMGFFLQPLFEQAFQSLLVVGLGLLITGTILKVSEKIAARSFDMKGVQDTSYTDVIFIGLLQGIAIVPGISRSGSTIAAGLMAGLERTWAARYSFLVAIPVILGAGMAQAKDISFQGMNGYVAPYIAGFTCAALFGYVAIRIVMQLVRQGRLSIFSYYCWALGLVVILASFWS